MSQVVDVEVILNKLTKLEEEIDKITNVAEDMRKRLLTFVEEEIESLREEVINTAKREAEEIISKAKKEAEEEARKIMLEAENNVTKITNNISRSFNEAVELALKRILTG